MKQMAAAVLALSIAIATALYPQWSATNPTRDGVAAAIGLAATAVAAQETQHSATEHGMRVRIIIEDIELMATLEDTAAGRDFASLLPLDLALQDYHGIEKISDLPMRLSTAGAPAGVDPDIGDITYYAPWGNLALFYRDFGYARGLVRLGRIHGDVTVLEGDKQLRARIERVEAPN